jgi:hypothetical protein
MLSRRIAGRRPVSGGLRQLGEIRCEVTRLPARFQSSTAKTDAFSTNRNSELKLYRSTRDNRWFAFDPRMEWVMFPAQVGGWQKRRPSGSINRIDMREVPLRMGFNTGIPGAPKSAAGNPGLPVADIRPIAQRHRKNSKITCLCCNLIGCAGCCRLQSEEVPALLKSA